MPAILALLFHLYTMRHEVRRFPCQSSNPKRERGRAVLPSLTLRVTFGTTRVPFSYCQCARLIIVPTRSVNHDVTMHRKWRSDLQWPRVDVAKTIDGAIYVKLPMALQRATANGESAIWSLTNRFSPNTLAIVD
jgi:hypothetical protein